jgi:sarcosine oxidase subunit delta
MLLIPCPWCGPRNEPEFTYGGEPTARPISAERVSDAEWCDYLYMRRNEKGPHREMWCHTAGCGQWFVLTRDTATHANIAAEKPGAAV